MDNYEDIISLSRPNSNNYKKMSIESRAAQFAPFSALTGFSEEIDEKLKFKENKKILSEEDKEVLNNKLSEINKLQKDNLSLSVIYYNYSLNKYVTVSDYFKKIDDVYKKIILKSIEINIEDIINLEFEK